jgi:Nif-specific regulatory protein
MAKKSEITFLYEISRMLNKNPHVEKVIYPILKHTCDYLGISCCILTIIKRNMHEVIAEEFYGLNVNEISRIKDLLEGGIHLQVIDSGIPMMLPKISHEPQFIKSSLDLVDFKYQIALICVPILAGKEILGTFNFSLEYYESFSFKTEFRILSIIGNMIASTVRALRENAAELAYLREENTKLLNAINEPISEEIIGSSSKMQIVYEMIRKVAKTDATVLLRGESGVGKELFANAIHFNSKRSNKLIVKVNCSALPENLIESELFGHEKGAFTGADSQRIGRFELSNEGTIFLDEIGDLPLNTQVKILRILQEREFERIGNSQTIKTNVRVIAATNRNLEEMIKDGKFREDLYYRLNIFPIHIPSLRDRRSDIPILINHFITKTNKKHKLEIKRIDSSAIDLLMMYHWPGNIRELENCVERAAIMSTDNVIRSSNLPPTLQSAESAETPASQGSLELIINNIEKQIIIDSLATNKGNVTTTAKVLKLTERILRLRIDKHGIDLKRFKHFSKQ